MTSLACASTPRRICPKWLGNSNSLVIGEWAIAIGNPFGFTRQQRAQRDVGVIGATRRNLIGPAR